ncbi:MAG: twin-arginine translocase TatA/TatE family subunit [Mariprofundaceae bacterium]|nr:twin-arginine translocase TatA/TatE family subunit [Mariprofundaceae bacterium]
MPDIGLFELLIIGIVLFLVVGPERMPEFFSQLGRWMRHGRGWMGQFREDLKRETSALSAPFADAKKDIQQGVDSLTTTARDIAASVQEKDTADDAVSGKSQDKD